MKKIHLTLIVILVSMVNLWGQNKSNEIDLSGKWGFQLDMMDFRVQVGSLEFRQQSKLHDSIILPAITDDYQIGIKNNYKHLDRLSRAYEYMGPAWYQKYVTIPQEWEGKRILLDLERCHWLSTVFVGAKQVGKTDFVSVPHRYDMTDFLVPGKENNMYVCVDNRFQYPTHKWDHAHSEYTQINWNGILGEMKLIAVDPVYITDLQIYPDVKNKAINIKTEILNTTRKAVSGNLIFKVNGEKYNLSKSMPLSNTTDSIITFEGVVALGNKIKLWDEFTPYVYELTCELNTQVETNNYQHAKSATFGMREVKQGKNQILINDKPVHMRGTVENAVFPKTGYVPVDDASWERVLSILKEYGMNHMRFHSWCPPKAAFRMADKLGVYLQVELPLWGNDVKGDLGGRYDFFRREQMAVLKEYGNHPSFVLYCNGNEISGDFDFVEELTRTGRLLDSRHLYSGSTARKRVPSDQYYTSHVTNKGSITVYEGKPATNWDRNKESDIDVPVIAHETGQRAMYPNYNEIPKYTGPVKPRNFEVFRDLLDKNGMLYQANDFFKASGALTVLEYKDVIEALLRSSKSGGFQLLSLNDFTGQGYAFVGILDPFWDSKGLVTAEEFRESCSETVPLLRFEKRALVNDEPFQSQAELYNYSAAPMKVSPKWVLKDDTDKVIKSGKLKTQQVGTGGVFELGDINFDLQDLKTAQRVTLHLNINDKVKNKWSFWVYPKLEGDIMQSTADVLYTNVFDAKAKQQLADGKKVVFYAEPSKVKGRKSNFHNHFWNPIMFQWPPMTLGCLIEEDHPVFNNFPTSYHTDWQWWDILPNAKVIEMQDMPQELRPFIQTIDAHNSNKKLGIGFEATVNGGKLLVMALDTKKMIKKRPATLQLLQSVDEYVKSDAFAPKVKLEEAHIESFLEK